ncbi:MAG TPA: hypothetical protein VF779_05470, partial [Pyrinomonadaceae bacterium]
MKIRRTHRQLLILFVLFSLLAVVAFKSFAESGGDKSPAPAIRVTPPAPVIDDNERLAELASRRSRVAEKIGPNGVLVLFSTEPR